VYIKSFDQEELFVQWLNKLPKPVAKNASTCILIHGLGGDSNGMLEVAHLLIKSLPDLQCLLYDQRGHGLSSKSFTQDRTLSECGAHDLATIINLVKTPQIVLIGHSLGGIIVEEYVNRFSPQNLKIVLICAPFKLQNLGVPLVASYSLLKKITPLTHKKLQRTLQEHLQFQHNQDLSLSRFMRDAKTTGIRQLLAMYLALFGWSNQHPENLNSEKVLFLVSNHDLLLPLATQLKWLKKMPKARIEVLDDNHLSVINNPEQVVSHLVAFIN